MQWRIVWHVSFQKEFEELLNKIPEKKRRKILQLFASQKRKLQIYGDKVIADPHFEKLKGIKKMDLYSLRLSRGNPNLRVIFTMLGYTVILLVAFEEKEKRDYDRAIEKAVNRFRELI